MTSYTGRMGKARIAIISIIPEEHSAVLRIGNFTHTDHMIDGTAFHYESKVDLGDEKYGYGSVLVRTLDAGNDSSSETTRNIIEMLRPDFIILCGIAGGIEDRWDAKVGNVIISNYVEGYEGQKLLSGHELKQKKALDHPSHYLRGVSDSVRVKAEWTTKIGLGRPVGDDNTPEAHFGNIISGEKLLGDGSNDYQRKILDSHKNAAAVDMESYGLARSAYIARSSTHYNLHYIVIRGISDPVRNTEIAENTSTKTKTKIWLSSLLGFSKDVSLNTGTSEPEDNQAMRYKWRDYACSTAAAFTSSVVEQLLPSDWEQTMLREHKGNG